MCGTAPGGAARVERRITMEMALWGIHIQTKSTVICGVHGVGGGGAGARKTRCPPSLLTLEVLLSFVRSVTSPRMPHMLGEIFTYAQLLCFKNRNSWAGRG